MREAVDGAFDVAANILYGKEDDVLRVVLIDTPAGSMVVACPWGSDAERAAILSALHRILQEKQATRYILISEVWQAPMDPALMARHGLTPPSERPDRIEALMVTGVERSGETCTRFAEIVRNDAGKRTLDIQYDAPAHVDVGGDLVDLFNTDSFYAKLPSPAKLVRLD